MWCWHRWKVKDKEVLPSLIEQMKDVDFDIKGDGSPSHKSCIVTYRCDKCPAEKVRRI